MDLGNFSLSLAVRDLAASKEFYGKLGFEPVGGDQDQGWLILQNSDHKIGLFQGMFEGNILTFNPGWDKNAKNVDPFTDVREIQKRLDAAGVSVAIRAEEGSGPAHIVLADPDGNQIMIDQHR